MEASVVVCLPLVRARCTTRCVRCGRLPLRDRSGPHCVVLCCVVLCCAVLCCAVLCCAVLWCAEGDVTMRQKAGMSTHGYR